MSSMPPPVGTVPQQPMPGSCPVCGAVGTLQSRQQELTVKQRPKFGVFWVLLTICTCSLAFFAWLVMPRKNVVVNVDRYLQCNACKARV
jgi:hypothetical protein